MYVLNGDDEGDEPLLHVSRLLGPQWCLLHHHVGVVVECDHLVGDR